MTEKDKYRLFCRQETSIPVFLRDWWLDITCGQSNWDVLLIEQKGQICASMPLFIPLKGIISMPPHTQVMGIWFRSFSTDSKQLTKQALRQEYCKRLIGRLPKHSSYCQNFHHSFTDWLPFYWNNFKQTTRYTYVLDNIHDETSLWQNMSQGMRRNITKAKNRNKIKIERGIPTNDFLDVYQQTFKRQKIKTLGDLRVLSELIAESRRRGQGEVWGGYDADGNLHAAAFIVWQKSGAWYIAGGGNPQLRHSGAHSLVLWECIKHVAQFTDHFDFEGSMIPGVEHFFRAFGAKQLPYFQITDGKFSLYHRALIFLKKQTSRFLNKNSIHGRRN